MAFRRDGKEEISDVKFSPANNQIAMGSHDNSIYIYDVSMEVSQSGNGRNTVPQASCTLKPLHRMRGHSSYITHIGQLKHLQISIRKFLFPQLSLCQYDLTKIFYRLELRQHTYTLYMWCIRITVSH